MTDPAPACFVTPCWEIDRDGWECPHFPTREAAEAERADYLAEYGNEDGPIRQVPYVCVPGTNEDGDDCHDFPPVPADASALSRG